MSLLLPGVALSMHVVLLLCIAVLTLVTLLRPQRRRKAQMAAKFPQPTGAIPLLGHLLSMLVPEDRLFWLGRDFRAECGSRYVLNCASVFAYNISDPEAVETMLSSSKHIDKSFIYDFLVGWLGRGLLTSSGTLWQSRRKLLTPAFHFKILEQFAPPLSHHAHHMLSDIREATGDKGGSINIVPIVSRCTLRAICETAMGTTDLEKQSPGGEENYFQAIHEMGALAVHRLCRPWMWFGPVYNLTPSGRAEKKYLKILHTYTEKVIAERRAFLEQRGWEKVDVERDTKRRLPFLDVLLTAQHEGAALSDIDIRNEVDTFMFEGHDTTSMAICWTLEMLGRHPEVQERLVEEIPAPDVEELTWESVSSLEYLDRVVKECLRLRPSVPFISRVTNADVDLGGGLVIPEGGICHVHVYDLHRHPDNFPDPERFDPDRFLPENAERRHPFAYIPFSAGPRNCIGRRYALMEVKILVAAVVREYKIQSWAKSDVPDVIADLVLRPRTGIKLTLTPRNQRSL